MFSSPPLQFLPETQSAHQPSLKELCQCLQCCKTHCIQAAMCSVHAHKHTRHKHAEVYKLKYTPRLTLCLFSPFFLFTFLQSNMLWSSGGLWRSRVRVLQRQKSFPLCWGGLWRVKPSQPRLCESHKHSELKLPLRTRLQPSSGARAAAHHVGTGMWLFVDSKVLFGAFLNIEVEVFVKCPHISNFIKLLFCQIFQVSSPICLFEDTFDSLSFNFLIILTHTPYFKSNFKIHLP